MRKLSKAKESKRLGDRKRICSLGLIMLLLGLSIAVLNSAIVAAQLPSPSEEAFNQSLIYRNFKFEHQLLGVGVYDAKWEQFLYGDQLEAELSVPSVSRLVLLSLVAERFNQDDLIFISSSAAVADRNLAAQSPDNILLSEVSNSQSNIWYTACFFITRTAPQSPCWKPWPQMPGMASVCLINKRR